jgi:hypothetical protein
LLSPFSVGWKRSCTITNTPMRRRRPESIHLRLTTASRIATSPNTPRTPKFVPSPVFRVRSHVANRLGYHRPNQDPLSKLEKIVFGHTDSKHPQDPATSPFLNASSDPNHHSSDVDSSHAVSSSGQTSSPSQSKPSTLPDKSSSSAPSPYVSLASAAADSGLPLKP